MGKATARFSFENNPKKNFNSVAGIISPRNNDDDNIINKGRYAVEQKTPSEREASSNNLDVDML